MRIIEADTLAVQEYLKARERDIPCTVRPTSQHVIEPHLAHFDGSPAYIVWDVNQHKTMTGWAIPYGILQARSDAVETLLALVEPGLVYNQVAQGFSTIHQWIERKGGTMAARRIDFSQPIETMFVAPRFFDWAMRRNMAFPALRTAFIFVGCDPGLQAHEARAIRAFLGPEVRVVVVYWRVWTGIIASIELDDITQPYRCGVPVVEIMRGFRSELHVRGEQVAGVTRLTEEHATLYTVSDWVPTGNTGRLSPDGAVFVTGQVAETSQPGDQTDVMLVEAKLGENHGNNRQGRATL